MQFTAAVLQQDWRTNYTWRYAAYANGYRKRSFVGVSLSLITSLQNFFFNVPSL